MTFNTILEPISFPLSQALGLPRLPHHFSTILASFLGYHVIQWTSPFVFRTLLPESYGKASKRVQQGWAVRTCSMVNALVLVPLAYRCLELAELNKDKIWGTHPLEGELEALACGYFLWDAVEESFVHFNSIGFAAHGVTVLFALLLTFRPLFAYTSVRFLLLETSTPFLNIHWALRQTGLDDSPLSTINGMILISTFFLARICFGTLTAYRFLTTLYEAYQRVPYVLGLIYAFGTVILQVLNWLWMYKMFQMLGKRASGGKQKAKSQ